MTPTSVLKESTRTARIILTAVPTGIPTRDSCTPRKMSPPTVDGATLLKNQPTTL